MIRVFPFRVPTHAEEIPTHDEPSAHNYPSLPTLEASHEYAKGREGKLG
jgi:hypothetical protein